MVDSMRQRPRRKHPFALLCNSHDVISCVFFQADTVELDAIDELKERFLQELLPELNSYFEPLAPLLSQYLE